MNPPARQSPSPENPATPTVGRAITAVRWTLLGSVLQRAITVLAVAALVRLLTETEFGAYRQIVSLHLVLFVVLPLGFDQLYIREVARRDYFAVLMGGALTVAGVLIAAALLVGHRFVEAAMEFSGWHTMLWLSPVIILMQAWKLFYKTDLAARLEYRQIAVGEMLYAFTSGLGAVGLALAWPTAWSLYAAYAAAELAELYWLRRASAMPIPPLRESLATFWRDARHWKRFGLFHCGMQVMNAVGGNAPVLIFGAAVSKAAAAAFSMGNYLVTIPIYILIGALHRVAYSALAGRTREQLKTPVLQILGMAAAFIVPVLIAIAALATPLVTVALGASWVEHTVPVLRWICLYCIFASLFSPVSSLDLLLDRPDYGFYWNIVATGARVAAVVVGLRYGVMEAVAAYAISSAAMWFVWGVLLARLLGAGQRVFHQTWLKFLPWWMGLGGMLWALVASFGDAPQTSFVSLAALVAVSAIPVLLYLGGVSRLFPDLTARAIQLFRRS